MSNEETFAFLTDVDTVIEVYKLAKEKNITPTKAFNKYIKLYPERFRFLGSTTDHEMLEANLREEGIYPKEKE